MSLVIHVQHRLDIERRTDNGCCGRHSAAAFQMVQVVHREPVAEMQTVVLYPLGKLLQTHAFILLLRGEIDKQPLSHGCR